MSNPTVKLTGSGAFQDIGTVGQTTPQLAGNIQSINQILDVGLRNTRNYLDSFLRVSDIVGLEFATLNGNILTAASFGGTITLSDGTTTLDGVTKITFSGATVSGTAPDGTVTISGGGGSTVDVQYSISGDGSSGSPLQLVNDTATPGANKVYGTNSSGVRGWQTASGGGGSTPYNITPDTHPATPTGVGLGPNDEFEYGTSIDLAGARYSGATPWAWVNQSGATANVALGSLSLTQPGTGGYNFNLVQQNVAAGTWTYQAKVQILNQAGGSEGGMIVGATNGTFVTLDIQSNQFLLQEWNSPTSYGGNTWASGIAAPSYNGTGTLAWVYMQIQYDGTNLIFSWSLTGLPGTFKTLFTDNASLMLGNVGLPPAYIGLCVNNQGTPNLILNCDFFRQVA